MTHKNKGRAGGNRATPKTVYIRNITRINSTVKATVMTLAVWGWFPLGLADWLVKRLPEEN